jgi:hypothetical protein
MLNPEQTTSAHMPQRMPLFCAAAAAVASVVLEKMSLDLAASKPSGRCTSCSCPAASARLLLLLLLLPA